MVLTLVDGNRNISIKCGNPVNRKCRLYSTLFRVRGFWFKDLSVFDYFTPNLLKIGAKYSTGGKIIEKANASGNAEDSKDLSVKNLTSSKRALNPCKVNLKGGKTLPNSILLEKASDSKITAINQNQDPDSKKNFYSSFGIQGSLDLSDKAS